MKPFNKDCKHAQSERANKWLYEENERTEGCWNCGGPLSLYNLAPHRDTSHIAMEDSVRAELERDHAKYIRLIDHINGSVYYCIPCWEKAKVERRNRSIEDYLTIEQIFATMDAEKWALIKEVEECGPDCPYYDRLSIWKADYNEDGTLRGVANVGSDRREVTGYIQDDVGAGEW